MYLLLAASSPWQTVCTVLALIFMLAMPAFILWSVKKVKFLGFIGAIALCYLLGLIVSVIPIPYDRGLTETVSSVFVAIAIPLILFTFDIGSVRYLAKSTVISFVLVIFPPWRCPLRRFLRRTRRDSATQTCCPE